VHSPCNCSRTTGGTALLVALLSLTPSIALAQAAPAANGTPPADVAQVVAAPTARDAPAIPPPTTDSTSAAVSAGGQFATGNSRLYAGTGQGKFDLRRGANGFGAALVGNFAETYATPAPTATAPAPQGSFQKSTENLQGKLRYDRYFTPAFGGFMQLTGTHDAFQAITFRLNVDPGVKLFVIDEEKTKLWGELGYDFEFDDNYASGGIEQAGPGGPQLDANGLPYVIEQEILVTAGLEYLQGFGGSGGGTPPVPPGYTAAQVDQVAISLTASRINFDALLAAHVGGGFSLGLGYTAKYNSAPLPGKVNLDTTGTLSLIYAFASPTPKPTTCPCPTEPPPPPPPPPGPPPVPPAPPAAAPAPAPSTLPAPAPTQPAAPSPSPPPAPAPPPAPSP
jgi:hypothetical protein